MPTKIWIFQHYATPPDTVSGTRHFNFARMLAGHGYDPTIFACGFNHSTYREERLGPDELWRVECVQGVRFFWIKAPGYQGNGLDRIRNMAAYAVRSYVASKHLGQVPGMIWASNPHLLSGLTGYLLAKKHRARFVFEVRDLWPQAFVDIGAFSSRHPVVVLMRMLERFIYGRADKIITLMPKASVYIEGCGVSPEKIVHLPHGVNLDLFQNPGEGLPAAIIEDADRLKSRGKVIIGYVGAHGIADALDSLLDSCAVLQARGESSVHFMMIGHGSEKRRLEERARDMKLDNISFYPAVPKSAVPAAIRLFDVALVCKKDSPLYKYGTSFIKTFDYMACGVPILWAVNSNDCPVLEGECGLAVPAENPERMAEAAVRFARMQVDQRKEMGLKGLVYVKNNHDNTILGQRLMDLFEGLRTAA